MTHRLLRIAMAPALAFVLSSGWAYAGNTEHSHQHPSHTPAQHATTRPAPVPATPWETDAALREGMQRIRSAVAQPWSDYQEHSLTSEVATTLATSIDHNVTDMINNCKLDPEADAALHGLLTELLAGAAEIRTDPHATDGMPRIVDALRDYPHYFSHPDWTPLQDRK